MTYDVEKDLAVALRQRAEHDVDARALLDGALVRGRRRQRRRRVAAVLCGAGVAGITAAAMLAGPLAFGRLDSPDVATTATASPLPPGQYRVPGLPDPTVTGATVRPGQVGKDPSTIHFVLDTVPLPVIHTSWSVDNGIEVLALVLGRAGGPEVTVEVSLRAGSVRNRSGVSSPPPTEVDIDGRPGMLTRFSQETDVLRWSPTEGLEAAVNANGLGTARTLALGRAVRFDRAARCATPAQVTALPPGATLRGCRLRPAATEPRSRFAPGVTLTVGDGTSTMDVSVGGEPVAPGSYNATASPARNGRGWIPDHTLVIYDFDGVLVHVILLTGYGRAEAELVADGLRRPASAHPERPDTWTTDLTG